MPQSHKIEKGGKLDIMYGLNLGVATGFLKIQCALSIAALLIKPIDSP
tara:strand:- start:61 stop:204 length:144 start_codon:yes stop_codon:yes gene_type:complete